jgi:hypothetical protein
VNWITYKTSGLLGRVLPLVYGNCHLVTSRGSVLNGFFGFFHAFQFKVILNILVYDLMMYKSRKRLREETI